MLVRGERVFIRAARASAGKRMPRSRYECEPLNARRDRLPVRLAIARRCRTARTRTHGQPDHGKLSIVSFDMDLP